MLLLFPLLTGCAADPESLAILTVKDEVSAQLLLLAEATRTLQDGLPAPAADGWGPSPALEPARAAWKDARVAYERVEGAIAVLFPELDAATDERYDGFIAESPDDYLFDGEGVTGVHAVERILWADAHPEQVVAFESALSGYVPAAFPATEGEATDTRDGLVGQLVADVDAMEAGFAPLALDAAAAYTGVVGSMAEQVEKVSLAATGEEESRYAQHTLADMRANLEGGLVLYAAFTPWLLEQEGGEAVDAEIRAGFARVGAAYDALPGEALPGVPEGWDADAPTDAMLATDYGQLWVLLSDESDPASAASLVERMVAAAELLGIGVVP